MALIKAEKADTYGNIKFRLTGRATSSYMCYAADCVIVEVEGLLSRASWVRMRSISRSVVDMVYVRKGEKKPFCPMWQRAVAKAKAKAAEGGNMALTGRALIASRCARVLQGWGPRQPRYRRSP